MNPKHLEQATAKILARKRAIDSALSVLNHDWQTWLNDNIERGVPLPSLADVMMQNGLAEAAIALLSDQPKEPQSHPSQSIKLPFIDVTQNKVAVTGAPDCSATVVINAPYVVVLDNFLSADECQALIDLSADRFDDATVVDDKTGDFIKHTARTSFNAMYERGENSLIAMIEQRIAEAIHWEVDRGEGLQVLRYQLGGEYKAHYDCFDANTVGGRKNMETGGQRVGTFLIYLSDVEAGGATVFPKICAEVRPKTGRALFFRSVKPNGTTDDLSLHASVPVEQGIKYLASKWLREKKYS